MLGDQQGRQWNLDVAKFMSDHASVIFGPSTEKQRSLAKIMALTFPPQISLELFTKLTPTAAGGQECTAEYLGTGPQGTEAERKPSARLF
jgi:hypothetical protein